MMSDQNKKQQMTSWVMLGSMLLLVGGLLTVWVFRFGDNLAYDRAHAQPINLPFNKIQSSLQSLGQLWDQKTGSLKNSLLGDDQNQGQTGQLTNAGLTNQQIDTIQTNLFENVAPQE